MDTSYRQLIRPILTADADMLEKKDEQYGASWAKRGGVGAFMMLARKWDRLENIVENKYNWDIFAAIRAETGQGDEAILDTIRDLRNYLTLVEAKVTSELGTVESVYTPDSAVEEGGTEQQMRAAVAWDTALKANESDKYGTYHEYAKSLMYMGMGGSEILEKLHNLNTARKGNGKMELLDHDLHRIVKTLNRGV